MPFKNRTEAGSMLATRAGLRRLNSPVVVSLPRGAVEVAAEVADALGAPLDVLPVVDFCAPGKPEIVVGAVAAGSLHTIDRHTLTALGVDEDNLAQRVAEATAEYARLEKVYRGETPARTVADRTVVVVDDGLATVPALSAVALSLTRSGASRILLATPVAPESKPHAFDDVIAVHQHSEVASVGVWYERHDAPSHEVAASLINETSPANGPEVRGAAPATDGPADDRPPQGPANSATTGPQPAAQAEAPVAKPAQNMAFAQAPQPNGAALYIALR